MACNVFIPQLLWSARIRRRPLPLFIVAFFINIGMWVERFVIVITSLHRDFLPSSWGMYNPTEWDWGMYLGTIGLFLTLLFLFIRFLPVISIFQTRTLLPEAQVHGAHGGGHEAPVAVAGGAVPREAVTDHRPEGSAPTNPSSEVKP